MLKPTEIKNLFYEYKKALPSLFFPYNYEDVENSSSSKYNKFIEYVENKTKNPFGIRIKRFRPGNTNSHTCIETDSGTTFFVNKFPGNCGILVLSSLSDNELIFQFQYFISVLECVIEAYNFLIITNIEYQLDYTKWGFRKIDSGLNLHSDNIIEIYSLYLDLEEEGD